MAALSVDEKGTTTDEWATPTTPEVKVPTKGELRKSAWSAGFKRAIQEFLRNECTDLAAGLTYFLVLAVFPGLLALVALLGLVSDGAATTDAVVKLIDEVGSGGMGDTLKPIVQQLTEPQGAGITLVIGVLGALWSASGYVRGFGRALNRIYGVPEGRGVVKLYAGMFVLTVVLVTGAAAVVFGAVMSGPIAEKIGDLIGLGDESVMIWNIAKWPAILFLVILMVALLYYATPNVQQPKFRWLSLGASIAILIWILASAGFGFYIGNFGSYNKTYGSLAGIIIFLLWLWLTNLALLFGAVVDAEVVRVRQLQRGIKAEKQIQLDPRDTTVAENNDKKYRQVIASSRELRQDTERSRRSAASEGSGPIQNSVRDATR